MPKNKILTGLTFRKEINYDATKQAVQWQYTQKM